MLRCLVLLALVLSGNTYAKRSSDMMESKARASLAPPPPTYPIAVSEIHAHYQALKLTRPLNSDEADREGLTTVAVALKIEKVTSMNQTAAQADTPSIRNAILARIKENPKWDMQLTAVELQSITPQLELLKKNFGDKSYVWAWFLKQTGKTTEAKQILVTLFDERCAEVMKMKGTFNRQSPMLPVLEVEQALIPLSTEAEKSKVQKKMQEVKVHVTNLQDYQIMT